MGGATSPRAASGMGFAMGGAGECGPQPRRALPGARTSCGVRGAAGLGMPWGPGGARWGRTGDDARIRGENVWISLRPLAIAAPEVQAVVSSGSRGPPTRRNAGRRAGGRPGRRKERRAGRRKESRTTTTDRSTGRGFPGAGGPEPRPGWSDTAPAVGIGERHDVAPRSTEGIARPVTRGHVAPGPRRASWCRAGAAAPGPRRASWCGCGHAGRLAVRTGLSGPPPATAWPGARPRPRSGPARPARGADRLGG